MGSRREEADLVTLLCGGEQALDRWWPLFSDFSNQSGTICVLDEVRCSRSTTPIIESFLRPAPKWWAGNQHPLSESSTIMPVTMKPDAPPVSAVTMIERDFAAVVVRLDAGGRIAGGGSDVVPNLKC